MTNELAPAIIADRMTRGEEADGASCSSLFSDRRSGGEHYPCGESAAYYAANLVPPAVHAGVGTGRKAHGAGSKENCLDQRRRAAAPPRGRTGGPGR